MIFVTVCAFGGFFFILAVFKIVFFTAVSAGSFGFAVQFEMPKLLTFEASYNVDALLFEPYGLIEDRVKEDTCSQCLLRLSSGREN